MSLTWLLPQSHDGHDIVRHVKVWKHGQVCQPVGQFVQMQHLKQIHYFIWETFQQELNPCGLSQRRVQSGVKAPVQFRASETGQTFDFIRRRCLRRNRCQVAPSCLVDFRNHQSTDVYYQRMGRLC